MSGLLRQITYYDVTVTATAVESILADVTLHLQFVGKEARLMALARRVAEAEYFLKRYNIGVCFAQDFNNAVRMLAPVEATTLVNVVGDDAHDGGRCLVAQARDPWLMATGHHSSLLSFQHPAKQLVRTFEDRTSLPFFVADLGTQGEVRGEIHTQASR